MATTTTINLGEVYRFLALSMQYPDRRWLNDDFLSLLLAFLVELGWEEEHQALAPLKSSSPDLFESLEIEHTRLFINSVPHVKAPPYGSYYLDSAGVLYGQSAEKTRDFYRQHGFDLAVATDIPDSLILELQFLAFLHEQGREAAEEEFLRKLFRPWFEKFHERVQKEAHTSFYKVVVSMIDFFTMEDER